MVLRLSSLGPTDPVPFLDLPSVTFVIPRTLVGAIFRLCRNREKEVGQLDGDPDSGFSLAQSLLLWVFGPSRWKISVCVCL